MESNAHAVTNHKVNQDENTEPQINGLLLFCKMEDMILFFFNDKHCDAKQLNSYNGLVV